MLFPFVSLTLCRLRRRTIQPSKKSFSPEKQKKNENKIQHEKFLFAAIFRLGEIQTFFFMLSSYSPKFSSMCLATSYGFFIITNYTATRFERCQTPIEQMIKY